SRSGATRTTADGARRKTDRYFEKHANRGAAFRAQARTRHAASVVSGKNDRRAALHVGATVRGTPVAQSIRTPAIESFLPAMNALDQIRLLLRLFGQPGAAMSGILDRGSLLF